MQKSVAQKFMRSFVATELTADAYHITSPAEDGAGAARAMQLAMQEAGILPSEVDYINAHGTGTHHNDLFETRLRSTGRSGMQLISCTSIRQNR